jgi:hypothetical protein
MMEQYLKGLTKLGRFNVEQAGKPIRLTSSYAQPVPGTTGVDPAYEDRSLLEVPGLDLPELFPNLGDVWNVETMNPFGPGGPLSRGGTRRRPPDAPIVGRAVPRPGSAPRGFLGNPNPADAASAADVGTGIVAPPTETPQPSAGLQRRMPSSSSITAPAEEMPTPDANGGTLPPGPTSLGPENALVQRLRSRSQKGRSPIADATQAEGAVNLLLELARSGGRAA